MSRSFKKIPYFNGVGGGESNKRNKRICNKKFRHTLCFKTREVMSTVEFAGEGKFFMKEATKKQLSK
jgi:hypothetical protein